MFTLLICGSHNNRVSVVSYLLERVADVDVDATDVEGQTALYHAALGGHTTVLRRLVRASAHPAKRNKVISSMRDNVEC